MNELVEEKQQRLTSSLGGSLGTFWRRWLLNIMGAVRHTNEKRKWEQWVSSPLWSVRLVGCWSRERCRSVSGRECGGAIAFFRSGHSSTWGCRTNNNRRARAIVATTAYCHPPSRPIATSTPTAHAPPPSLAPPIPSPDQDPFHLRSPLGWNITTVYFNWLLFFSSLIQQIKRRLPRRPVLSRS